jgi:hypothetical protein
MPKARPNQHRRDRGKEPLPFERVVEQFEPRI